MMKKTLVAVAAMAAVSAFAQSSVTISGNIDAAYVTFGGDTAEANKGATINSTSTQSTSAIAIKATEDLGGGMSASFQYEIDPRASFNDTDGVASAASQARAGDLRTGQNFIRLAGTSWGSIQLGKSNNPSFSVTSIGSVFGTGVGSGYAALNSTVGMQTRANRTAYYISPVFSGFQGHLMYAPGNDTSGAAPVAASSALPYQRSFTDLALTYTNGPLVVGFASLAASSTDQAATVSPTGAAVSGGTTFNTLSAKYSLGNLTGFASFNNGKTLGSGVAAGLDTKGQRIGVSYVMGATTLGLNAAQQDIEFVAGTTTTRKVVGAQASYALSKRSNVYLGLESSDTGTALIAGNTATGTLTTTAFGIRHQF